MRHGLRGQSYGAVSACAAGRPRHRRGRARMIQCGDADAFVAGGSEAALTPLATRRLRALAAHLADAASRARSTRAATAS